MIIDTNTLDILKTYVICEVGSSKISNIIQNISCKLYPQISPQDAASHVLALRYKNNNWTVWECHLKWGGIKEYLLSDYKADKDTKELFLYEYCLDNASMDYWLANNPTYSVTNLFEIAEERLIGLKLPNTHGWVCSESVAACNFDICLKLNKLFSEIIPLDFQVFLKDKIVQHILFN